MPKAVLFCIEVEKILGSLTGEIYNKETGDQRKAPKITSELGIQFIAGAMERSLC